MMDIKELYSYSNKDFTQFEGAALQYFKTKFNEVGGVGAEIERAGVVDAEYQSPFIILCEELASRIVKQHEFRPFKIKIIWFREYSAIDYGMLVDFNDCHLSVSFQHSTATVALVYSWPEPYAYSDNNGFGSGGSHKSKNFKYELANPGSVELITARALEICRMMLTKERYVSDLYEPANPGSSTL